ncbi:MAG: hypothetical protein PHQ19_05575, partial [Candidatus Krumholzibacteria bacterium]|nr:hypothetical protein [Candidatus Krumholzibacteria bacterium]
MRLDSLARHFEAIGARVKCAPFDRGERRWRYRRMPAFSIDILTDRDGEFFKLDLRDDAPEFEVLQVLPRERHLLLITSTKRRFLCGHDERRWFVAEIHAPVSTVRDAKRALMPPPIREE